MPSQQSLVLNFLALPEIMILVQRLLKVLFLLLISFTLQAKIMVHVDRNEISVNESFKLIFESDKSVDDDPDFSPLSLYFEVLNTSQSSNMSIVNGSVSRKKTWTLSLMPKQVGKIAIPAISFGSDKSQPAIITITEQKVSSVGSSESDIFVQAEIDDNSVVVDQQVLLTVKIYTRLNISSAQLSEPKTLGFNSKQQQLGKSSQYRTQLGQKTYTVLQQKYLITPQSSGIGSISPITLQAEIGQGRSGFFSPFGQSKIVKLQTQEVDIKVKGKFSKDNELWLPTEELKISSELDDGPYQQGEPINLTITMSAIKQVAELLPILPLPKHDSFKSYADQPVFKNTPSSFGVNGSLVQKYAIIPQQGGEIVIPAYSIKWWNIKAERFEVATIPARTLSIKASNKAQTIITVEQQNKPASKLQEDEVTLSPKVLYWQLLSLALFVLWIATWLFYAKRPPSPKIIKQTKPKDKPKNKHIKMLMTACKKSQAKQVQKLLVQWAQGNIQQTITNIQQIKPFVKEGFEIEIDALQHALYSDTKGDWNGLKLLKMIKEYKPSGKHKQSNEFRRLYP